MNIVVATRVRDEIEVLSWYLANLRFADVIYISDGGSADGSWEAVLEAANSDSRIIPVQYASKKEPFFEEYEHLHDLFNTVYQGVGDWILNLDVDEIPSIVFQKRIRPWLHVFLKRTDVDIHRKIGLDIPFYFLCHGWTEYYTEPSSHPILRMYNHIPTVVSTTEDLCFEFKNPARECQYCLPSCMSILHFNWALEERFSRKRKQYERRFGYPSWHPDEKFGERTLLPGESTWYSPNGEVMTPEKMKEILR